MDQKEKENGRNLHTVDRSNVTTNHPLLPTNQSVIGQRRQNKVSHVVPLKFNVLGLLPVYWNLCLVV
jgi:hypothetical protein